MKIKNASTVTSLGLVALVPVGLNSPICFVHWMLEMFVRLMNFASCMVPEGTLVPSCCVGMLGLGCESSWMCLFIQGGIKAALPWVAPRFWPRGAAGKDLPRGCPGSRAPAACRRQRPLARAAGQATVPERALEHMDCSA